VERFTLSKVNELEIKKENYIKISNRSAVLENSNESQDINMAGRTSTL